jgi:hypothetical protein
MGLGEAADAAAAAAENSENEGKPSENSWYLRWLIVVDSNS